MVKENAVPPSLFLLPEGTSLEVFSLALECLSLSQGMAASYPIPEPGGMRSGLKREALSRLCHLLFFLKSTDGATATVEDQSLPSLHPSSSRSARLQIKGNGARPCVDGRV